MFIKRRKISNRVLTPCQEQHQHNTNLMGVTIPLSKTEVYLSNSFTFGSKRMNLRFQILKIVLFGWFDKSMFFFYLFEDFLFFVVNEENNKDMIKITKVF